MAVCCKVNHAYGFRDGVSQPRLDRFLVDSKPSGFILGNAMIWSGLPMQPTSISEDLV